MERLLTVTKNGVLVEEYGYDPNGTRNYEMNLLRGIAGRILTYSDEDHLLSAGDTTYQHDEDGFLTTKTESSDITIYDYSLRGELLSVTLPDGTQIGYLHDPLGRRIAKKINGTVVEKYLWQGMTRLLAVYDGSDNLLMRFEYADARMPVVMTKGGVAYYLAYDQVGSLKAVADASGNVVKNIGYDSFGNVISDSNPAFHVPFGFAGGLHDRDTGLVRFGYRDYDPDTGRWTAKDPIFFAGGDTDLYGYCVGDPVNFADPDGLQSMAPPAPVPFPPVVINPTPEQQASNKKIADAIWKWICDNIRPIPDYEGNKKKFEKSKRPIDLKDGGPCKETPPPPPPDCERLLQFIETDAFEKLPLKTKILYQIMIFYACYNIF